MKDNSTSINVVIDRSGSMMGLTNDTIGGFNSFLQEQKAVPGEAVFTLAMFSDDYQLVHDCVPIADVPELTTKTYVARGGTALLDALGRTIDATGVKLAAMKEEDRPSKVIFMVLTDGEENQSKAYAHAKIMEMIKHQTEVYNWTFVYLGAGQNAIQTGNSMGFNLGSNTSAYYQGSGAGTRRAYQTLSSSLTSSRITGQAMNVDASALIDDVDVKTTNGVSTPDTK